MNFAMARKRQFEEKEKEDDRIAKRQRSSSINVFDAIMETAGITIRKDCANLIFQYLKEFEGEITGEPLLLGVQYCYPNHRKGWDDHVKGWDEINGVVFMYDKQIDLKTLTVTDRAKPSYSFTFPLCRVGNRIWEIEVGAEKDERKGGIHRRSETGEEDSPVLFCNYVLKSWIPRMASSYYDQKLNKQVVAIRLNDNEVSFLDAETGLKLDHGFSIYPSDHPHPYLEWSPGLTVLESKLAFVTPIIQKYDDDLCTISCKLVVYDLPTRLYRSEEFIAHAFICGFWIHSIGNRICLVSNKSKVDWECGDSAFDFDDILIFDEELKLIKKIQHGYMSSSSDNQHTFVVDGSLYLVNVYKRPWSRENKMFVVKLT